MPAWINRSLKIVSSAVFYIVVTITLLGAVFHTLVTGWTIWKAVMVVSLFVLWLLSYIILIQKLYGYLFGKRQ
ncbi:hypothetical protein QRD89_01215 [Halobacillus sp. ACCC02827]|uniref:hypothetical protein n=1 Tax=Bacillaceae TaxID=186817 RepID=UPI0002A4EC39|nr:MULTISPECIES: hypothetical protein [Bacillaceae]ELK47505.1 hypothetical protein D479_06518 [Halobacillus sp. BAB-2008]QHT45234.1 hypothetical protein M662_01340 [Bacillus sp. SB49]WJE16014.1 hypothetical protein QRD89_01215 [Halobacillus sp. ACCC02827]